MAPAPTAPESSTPQGTRPTDPAQRILALITPREEKASQSPAPESPVEEETPAPEQSATAETPADQAEAESEGAAEAPEATEEAAPATHTVVIDGQVRQVPLSELIAGYQQSADYTRKTQLLSEQRRAVEAAEAAARDTREQYAQRLEAAEQFLRASIPPEPDWNTLKAELSDSEFAKRYAEHSLQRERLGALQGEIARINEQRTLDAQQELVARVQQEQQLLLQRLPDWKVAEKAKADQTVMLDAAKAYYGYTDAELENITDHRAVLVLRDAALYRQMLAAKPKVQQQKVPAPMAKPGARSPLQKGQPGEAARQRLRQSGSVDDAAAVFFERLNARTPR